MEDGINGQAAYPARSVASPARSVASPARLVASPARSVASQTSECGDRVVGLDVGGRLFYTSLSTLTNASSYFTSRFNGNLEPGAAYRDERGRDVYFLDRSPRLFEYVLDFLREGVPTWPSFEHDPVLWRRLQAEAYFFGIDNLVGLLPCREHQCSPQSDGSRGVLHWLGTAKGKGIDYQNPCAIGEVNITGVLDKDCSRRPQSEYCLFVQYQPLATANLVSRNATPNCMVLWCNQARRRDPSVISFKTITVRPTFYSLRYDGCNGMNVWDFEGSIDGRTWTTLHKARCDPYLLKSRPSEDERGRLRQLVADVSDERRKGVITTDWAERNCRHTWELDPAPTDFFRHFRFIGVGEREWHLLRKHNEVAHSCMHGIGFEIFGDVRDTSSDI